MAQSQVRRSASAKTRVDAITERVIGAAIEVHRELGPGLLEAAYEECLARELVLRDIPFERQKPVPLTYKGSRVDVDFRLDFLVGGLVVVELKAVEAIQPIHEAQVITYLKLAQLQVALLINFNTRILKNGIHRLVLGLEE